MAEFLTTTGTCSELEKIFIDAQFKVVLISPYLQISKNTVQRMKEASDKNILIQLVYRTNKLEGVERTMLMGIENLELYHIENLHAKCYFNESKMIITSMNLYEFSEKNREMGILIDSKSDSNVYNKAVQEYNSIIKISRREYLGWKNNNKSYNNYLPANGYCIRCEKNIPYDQSKPFCYECFSTWIIWQDMSFKENVCHCCGVLTNPISMSKPQCFQCNLKYPALKM